MINGDSLVNGLLSQFVLSKLSQTNKSSLWLSCVHMHKSVLLTDRCDKVSTRNLNNWKVTILPNLVWTQKHLGKIVSVDLYVCGSICIHILVTHRIFPNSAYDFKWSTQNKLPFHIFFFFFCKKAQFQIVRAISILYAANIFSCYGII